MLDETGPEVREEMLEEAGPEVRDDIMFGYNEPGDKKDAE